MPRKQSVAYKNVESELLSVNFDVPQGSNLGIFSLIIFMNVIVNIVSNMSNVLFADYIKIFFGIHR